MDNDRVYTRDMFLAAALLSYGSQVEEVDRSDPKRQVFYFDRLPEKVIVYDGEECSYAEIRDFLHFRSLFLSKKLTFPPNYVDCQRSIKNYLYEE